jgi:hypothetical protein
VVSDRGHVPTETELLTRSLRKMGLLQPGEVPIYEALPGGVSSEIWRVDLRCGSVCVKRALAKLRVEKDWFAPIERNRYEVAWMKAVSGIVPGAAPRVVGQDVEQNLFAMEFLPPESHPLWKLELRRGITDAGFAAQIGSVLGRIHAATSNRPDVAAEFPTDFNFHSIRLEPYLEATARVHTDLATRENHGSVPIFFGAWRRQPEEHTGWPARPRIFGRGMRLVRGSGVRPLILPESPALEMPLDPQCVLRLPPLF